MPRKKKMKLPQDQERFGVRLAQLRKAAGYSQRGLAAQTGISQRMIAYYEKQADYPPTHILPVLAQALAVTTDQMLGLAEIKTNSRGHDSGLWRRFQEVEKLPPPDRKQIAQLLDTFLEKDKLKRRKSA
jgi:transcriptional regulator with XRE-family HTH domain